jgi:hypothetical protein
MSLIRIANILNFDLLFMTKVTDDGLNLRPQPADPLFCFIRIVDYFCKSSNSTFATTFAKAMVVEKSYGG